LSAAEVDALLLEIQRRAGKQGQAEAESPVLQRFRELAKSDDGRDYYMVNLLKFRKKALYPEGVLLGMIRWQPMTVTTGRSSRSC
jgi:hypothetical protein